VSYFYTRARKEETKKEKENTKEVWIKTSEKRNT
jgi:hypothetical protein